MSIKRVPFMVYGHAIYKGQDWNFGGIILDKNKIITTVRIFEEL